uniref:Helicase ATP-binding domain-containing protein n=1 Tax=Globisporangium ultimum (strain ATCC 200006 / CBS 805.95 / DAOM BR144) TaxID=431595 RepID=K3X4V5_GLOUD
MVKTALPAWVEVIDVDDDGTAVEVKAEAVPLVIKTEEQAAVVDVKTEVHAPLSSALTEVDVEPSPAAPAPELLPPPDAPANKVMIMGYNVDFPMGKKPFPAQLAVMNKVLLSLKTSQHALLESPTGSGKTLALLCSSLTFQRQYVTELLAAHEQQRKIAKEAYAQKMKVLMDKVQQAEAVAALQQQYGNVEASGIAGVKAERIDDDDFALSQPSFERFRFPGPKSAATGSGWISMESKKSTMKMESEANDDFDSHVISSLTTVASATIKKRSKRVLPVSSVAVSGAENDGDDDMESPPELKKLKTKKRTLPSSFAVASVAASSSMGAASHESFHTTPSSSGDAADTSSTSTSSRLMPPKIFFCSRTHSQLSQVVDELKNCPVSYMQSPDATNLFASELKMCVLGSKSHFCINKKANKDPAEVDDKCRQLLDVNKCAYATKRRNTNDLRRLAPPVWDIEDLVALAKRHRECAFFHARDVLVDANIVFCPYNYVLDPSIRSAVNISLKNAIIIFDEAHNVEDTCRSSASMELNTEVLGLAIKAFTAVIKNGNRPPRYHSLLKLLNGLNRWLQTINKHPNTMLQPTGFEEESKVWSGTECIAMFAEYTGMTPETFKQIKADLVAVSELEKELSSGSSDSQPSQASKSTGRGSENDNQDQDALLLGTLALSTVQTVLHVADYMFRDELKYLDDFKLVVRKSRVNRNSGGRFRGAYDTKAGGDGWELKMCIWCLNAAVAFSDVVKQCRSVILTSGTLSPMDSFAGELGTDFPIRLEANHVVNMRKQVFAGAIMNGPGRVDLSATFKNQQEFRYQDSMGQLLLQYVNVIPGGVLMFFPSYSLMDKLVTRWQQTGVWAKVDAVKTMFSEPRKAGKDFDALLDDYKYVVANAGAGRSGTKTGAVFLAVYRGKVSEGIDFANDNARAVLCVGIPFPNVKELQVSLKRQYQNEKSQVDKKLVNGAVWYQLQAFRALNQALGRCIRHRKDYGAILLIDSRHRFQAHTKSLSKWLRPFIQEVENSELCLPYFTEFFERNAFEFGAEAGIAAAFTPAQPAPMVLNISVSDTLWSSKKTEFSAWNF